MTAATATSYLHQNWRLSHSSKCRHIGSGGDGGDRVDAAQSGDAGSPDRGGGGSPGSNGHGIIFSSNSVQNNSSGNKTLSGSDGGVIVGGVA